ncbi:hypothetical protein [Chondromyces apiculatus]|uniref:Uncharacterized protein n=1 Tax=Chondromyces apiculatus DSM 436 TaxID=1192034 RepID=A0A017SUM4_9BACT|nr:hypothetical protein [Chondromyces apiculatus]EYF00683.1 Hypothetical protein CAP_0374 [Chondromyces apiculatus DSM 436]
MNCNATKQDKDVQFDRLFLPDRDNTSAAFHDTADGKVTPAPALTHAQQQIASDTLVLVGLDKSRTQVTDENGTFVAIDRVAQRMEVRALALSSLEDLQTNTTAAMRRQIVRTAQGHGFFSLWMSVFAHDPVMTRMLIEAFEGTATEGFDPETGRSLSPRPSNGLPHAGKI